jgi:very-short-patch-repair endonuclease
MGGWIAQERKNCEKAPWRPSVSFGLISVFDSLEETNFEDNSHSETPLVDFVCLERRLVVEVDGGKHNTQVVYDEQRTPWIEEQGFRVSRFWDHQVMQNIEAVKEAIWQALERP